MRVVFTASDEFGLEISGTFSIDRVSAEAIVSRQFAEHGIGDDRNLLAWLQSLPESDDDINVSNGFPEEDRLSYVLSELIDRGGDIRVRCGMCNAFVPLDSITVQEKDFSRDVSGIRVGFAGDLYQCPHQHGILFVVTKLF